MGTPVQISETTERTLARSDYKVMELDSMSRRSGERYKEHSEEGFYCCAHCGARLLSSTEKFAATGRYPSFRRPIARSYVKLSQDYSYGTPRQTVSCAHCGLYLGMVLNTTVEGKPTQYFGILSISVEFEPRANAGDAPTYIEEEESEDEPVVEEKKASAQQVRPSPVATPQPEKVATKQPEASITATYEAAPVDIPPVRQSLQAETELKPTHKESTSSTLIKYAHIALFAAPLLMGLYNKYYRNPSQF